MTSSKENIPVNIPGGERREQYGMYEKGKLQRTEEVVDAEAQKYENEHIEGLKQFEKPMQEYFQMAEGISKAMTLTSAIKFKIFDTIEELGDSVPVKELINKLNFKTNPRHVLDFLDQLAVFGYLEREGVLENSRYSNSDYARKYLVKRTENTYAHAFQNLACVMKRFVAVENDFPAGKTHLFSDVIYKDKCDAKAHLEFFYKANVNNFENLLNTVDFSKHKTIIDVRGGYGYLAEDIKKKCHNCQVISYDNSKLKDVVNERVKDQQNLNVQFEWGDLQSDKIPEADCIIAPHIIMQYGEEKKKKICEMLFNRLRPNGELVIMEYLLDNQRSKQSCGLKISSMLSLLGYEGYEQTPNEVVECLREIGFKDVKHFKKGHCIADLIVARK